MITPGSRRLALRITVAVLSAAVIGGSLAGCSRLRDHEDGDVQQPAAVNSSTPAPVPTTGSAADDSSLSSIQADLDAADSSTANADGDVAAADAASATNDNP